MEAAALIFGAFGLITFIIFLLMASKVSAIDLKIFRVKKEIMPYIQNNDKNTVIITKKLEENNKLLKEFLDKLE